MTTSPMLYLRCGVFERLVTLHVAVDPHSLVFLLPLHHISMVKVMLVVAPGQVVDGGLVQHGHHSLPLVKGGEEVGSQEVTSQQAAGGQFDCVAEKDFWQYSQLH